MVPDSLAAFEPGQLVRMVDGAFRGASGMVVAVDVERRVVRVSVRFYGRDVLLGLDFLSVVPATA